MDLFQVHRINWRHSSGERLRLEQTLAGKVKRPRETIVWMIHDYTRYCSPLRVEIPYFTNTGSPFVKRLATVCLPNKIPMAQDLFIFRLRNKVEK